MSWLKLKGIDEVSIDSPERTILHGKIIRSKPFLKLLYSEWYQKLADFVSYNPTGVFVELGSGGGFVKELFPKIITSDVMDLPGVDKVFFGEKMPFSDSSVDGILMIDVFHHIPEPEMFLKEAQRVLKVGGRIVMSEPWNSVFGRFVYKNFHHEPFETEGNWSIPPSGPLSGANGALPWIIFERDNSKFKKMFPDLELIKLLHHTPFRYLLSGGVSMKQLIPDFMFKPLSLFEKVVTSQYLNMFAFIVIEKTKSH
jgi:SAM-dependent methyltransferase